jgi:hypothetical protein
MPQLPDIKQTRRDFLHSALLLPVGIRLQNRPAAAAIRFLSYDEAEPVIQSGKLRLPSSLSSMSGDAIRAAWPQWVRNRDLEIRSRLDRGEEDTLANFVLFGVSFTGSSRVVPDTTDTDEKDRLIRARVRSFVEAVASPAGSERLSLLAGLITRLGYSAERGEARERLAEYVLQNVSRYLAERERYQSAMAVLAGNDTSPINSAASSLYKDRGLSIDTDFRPNYAIDAGLAEVKRRGLLRSVRRVAIIGPGLDFTDKDSGFDHYPLQTLQPFAVVDSLIRLGLSRRETLQVSVLEISRPALDHIRQAAQRARAGQSYTLQLVLDQSRAWSSGALDYWRRLGTTIGSSLAPLPLPPQVVNAGRRAVRIRPEIVGLLEPLSLDIVLQRLALTADQQYDLVIGTNIFIYYEAFEQALALLNVESMLVSGGVFLTNDFTEEYPGVRLRPAGITRVTYGPNQLDQVQIYSRPTFGLQLPPA